MAGSLGAFSSRNGVGISGSFLSRDLAEGMDLLSEVWLNPAFPAEQVAKAKAEQAAALRAQQDSPTGRAFLRFSQAIYANHPFGLNYLGTPESLAGLGRDQLLAAHQRVKGPGGCVLAVVGDVDPEQVEQLVQRYLGKAKGQAETPKAAAPVPPTSPRVVSFHDPKAKQTQIILGYLAPTALDPRRYALGLQEAILGGMGGELFLDLRDKRSLAYTVQPFYTPGRYAAIFGVYMAVGPGKEKEALAGLQEHLSRAAERTPGQEDLERAKNYVLGGMAIGLQSYAAQATVMASDELLGLGFDYYTKEPKQIEAVTGRQVLEVTKEALVPDKVTQLTQGPETK
jgi:zinc protease